MRRNPWVAVAAGVCALVGVLAAGVAGHWRYANQLPVYPAPHLVMPLPNAYDDYVAAGQMCEAAGGAAVEGAAPGSGPPRRAGLSREAFEPGVSLAEMRAVVARNRPSLARLREGFRKTYRSPPLVSFNQGFPELATFRELARVLVTEGKRAEREGRPDDAARSYLDCLRLGVDVPRGGPLIHGLVGIAVQSIAMRPLEEVADRLDGAAAAAAAREVVHLETTAPSLADTLANEKEAMTVMTLETLRQPGGWRQMFAGMGSSAPSAEEVLLALRFSFTPKRRMLDNVRRYMDVEIADARRPYWSKSALPPLPGDPLSQMVLPVYEAGKFRWAVQAAHWRIIASRLAARADEQQHGAPPSTLAQLVPAYLPTMPQDPFAPKPLIYRRTAAGVLIYSRGPDGKDDGGLDLSSPAGPLSRGDIVSMEPGGPHPPPGDRPPNTHLRRPPASPKSWARGSRQSAPTGEMQN